MTDKEDDDCIACLMIAVIRDELHILIPYDRAFGHNAHLIFGRLQQRRDSGDLRGGHEEGEILGRQFAEVGVAAGLTQLQLIQLATRLASPNKSGGTGRVSRRLPEYHEPST